MTTCRVDWEGFISATSSSQTVWWLFAEIGLSILATGAHQRFILLLGERFLNCLFFPSVSHEVFLMFIRSYKLDMTVPVDRLAAIRLAELGADENYYIKVESFTS